MMLPGYSVLQYRFITPIASSAGIKTMCAEALHKEGEETEEDRGKESEGC